MGVLVLRRSVQTRYELDFRHRVVITALASFLLSPVATAAEQINDEVTSISICALLSDPPKYNHALVKLTGIVSHGFEGFTFADEACPKESIWLEYGGLRGSGTIFAGSPSSERKRAHKLEVEGIQTSLIEDKKLEALDRKVRLKRATQTDATLIGRYYAGELVNGPFGSFQAGYGHLGMFSLLVIQQVVTAE